MPIRFIPVPDPYPQTKPATEFIGGKLVQKMSPRGLHAGVQIAIGASLWTWARERACGRVGTEWDYDITPPGEQTNRLVPDVAYLSFERLSYEDEEAAQIPKLAPNVAIEVLSPGQTMDDLAEKARIFLAAGCELVVVIDPREQYAALYDAAGVQRIERDEYLTHAALPGFDAVLASFFETPKPKS
jgi:Uma2 family endonuclease